MNRDNQPGWIHKDGYATSILADAGDLSADGTEIQLIQFCSGKYEHYHNLKTEFFYFLSGKGIMTADGRTYNIFPGFSITIRPGILHTFIVNEGQPPLKALMVKTNNLDNDTFTT